MSAYVEDLQVLLNCQKPQDFRVSWVDFRNRHYPGQAHANAFLAVFELIYAQVSPAQRWRLFFLFCENRKAFASEDFEQHRVLFDAHRIINHLAGRLGITAAEMKMAVSQMRDLGEPSEVWQYDRILNWLAYRLSSPAEILARQQHLLSTGALNSLYDGIFHTIAAPRYSKNTAPATEDGIDLTPVRKPEPWRFFGHTAVKSGRDVRIFAPFCYDTNHLEGAGLFCLLASCDLTGLLPASGLCGVRLNLTLRIETPSTPHRILLGIGGPMPEEAHLPEPRTSYWLRNIDLASAKRFAGEVVLSDEPEGWIAMGRNPNSPPYLAYANVPIQDLLLVATGLFLVLMQDDDPHPKRGSVYLGDMRMHLPES